MDKATVLRIAIICINKVFKECRRHYCSIHDSLAFWADESLSLFHSIRIDNFDVAELSFFIVKHGG